MYPVYTDELYHYGVLGMRWGIRRYQPYSVKPRASGKQGTEVGEAAEHRIVKERKQASRQRRTLSDQEIKDRITRIKLERELKSLTDEDLSPGKSAAKEILSKASKTVLTAAVSGAMAYALNSAIKTHNSTAASYIAPNPNKKK